MLDLTLVALPKRNTTVGLQRVAAFKVTLIDNANKEFTCIVLYILRGELSVTPYGQLLSWAHAI